MNWRKRHTSNYKTWLENSWIVEEEIICTVYFVYLKLRVKYFLLLTTTLKINLSSFRIYLFFMNEIGYQLKYYDYLKTEHVTCKFRIIEKAFVFCKVNKRSVNLRFKLWFARFSWRCRGRKDYVSTLWENFYFTRLLVKLKKK